jgi:hypothetical protein
MDETGKMNGIDLRKWDFLPNCYYSEVRKLLCKKREKCLHVIYSRNQFGTDKEWVSEKKSAKFKYPLVHSTPGDGPRIYWSTTKDPDVRNSVEMFGQKKVIFGESGINDVIVDLKGDYGMTQGAIGLKIESKNEGSLIKKGLESEGFERILKALNFGNFRIDWRVFSYFKKDFYKCVKTGKTKKNLIKNVMKNRKTLKI